MRNRLMVILININSYDRFYIHIACIVYHILNDNVITTIC